MTKVPNTGPKGKAPRGALPMVKNNSWPTVPGLPDWPICGQKFFLGKLVTFREFGRQKLKLDTLKKLATLKIWPVLTIFHTFVQTKNNIKLANFPEFGPFLP